MYQVRDDAWERSKGPSLPSLGKPFLSLPCLGIKSELWCNGQGKRSTRPYCLSTTSSGTRQGQKLNTPMYRTREESPICAERPKQSAARSPEHASNRDIVTGPAMFRCHRSCNVQDSHASCNAKASGTSMFSSGTKSSNFPIIGVNPKFV